MRLFFFAPAFEVLRIAPSIIQDIGPYGTTSSRRPTRKVKRAGETPALRNPDRGFAKGWGRAAAG
jgi:hypothetical protein